MKKMVRLSIMSHLWIILTFIILFFTEGVVFLEPKKILNENSEGSTSVNRAQGSLSVRFHPNV